MVCITLTIFAIANLIGSQTALAEDTTDWPEQLYYPPIQTQHPAAAKSAETALPTTKPEKGGGWLPFHKKEKASKNQPKTNETVVDVGPKDPPPSPYPLLRLSMPILADTGLITPGIYLIKPATKTETSEPEKHSANSSLLITLTRQNKIIIKVDLHAVHKPDENIALTGTPSPITRVNPKAPPVLKIEAQLSEDQKTMTLMFQEGENHFESDPFPVATDQRPILKF